jgi:hypothetical protein
VKIFSTDAETNGLTGQAFAVAAIVTDDDGSQVAEFVARCPIVGPVDPWVAANVLPHIEDILVTHGSYVDMLEAFYAFYMAHKEGADVIGHVVFPVETTLFGDMIRSRPERVFDGPYPLYDTASILRARGLTADSTDDYNERHGIIVPFEGAVHHPLIDAWSAERCYRHLMGG